MKKAISQWSFPAEFSIATCIEGAKAAGFDGIELAFGETGALSMECSIADVKQIRDMAADTGLELPSIATTLCGQYSAISPDLATAERGRDVLKKYLECAAALGVPYALVVPCAVGPDLPYDDAHQRMLDAYPAFGDMARDLGVTICVENVWNKFLLSPLEFRDTLDAINHPNVKAYFDVGNVMVTGFPDQWIRILGDRIKAVHVKDFRTSIGNINGFVDLLEGDVPWPEVMAAFREVGYDYYLTAEMMPPYRHHSRRLIEATARSLQAITEDY
ncbi:MAG: sugar phosphate isomerase/epimerase family protein [Armatimonadota bacterium]